MSSFSQQIVVEGHRRRIGRRYTRRKSSRFVIQNHGSYSIEVYRLFYENPIVVRAGDVLQLDDVTGTRFYIKCAEPRRQSTVSITETWGQDA